MNSRGAVRTAYVCQTECVELTSQTRLPGARINDISVSGAFVESMVVFEQGARVHLGFDVEAVPVSVTAEIVNPMPTMGMGVRFLDLAPEAREAIASLAGQGPN